MLGGLLIYRKLLRDGMIQRVERFFSDLEHQSKSKILLQTEYYNIISRLLEYGFKNNVKSSLWKNYIFDLILEDENVFTLACERSRSIDIGIEMLAKRDLSILIKYINIDWDSLAIKLGIEPMKTVSIGKKDNLTVDEVYNMLLNYYHQNGSGILGKYKAFRWEDKLVGIEYPDEVRLSDIVGYEHQKKTLTDNTEKFLEGKKANNVLLFGDRGTGKSSSVKALLNEYAHRGLRLIELNKNQLVDYYKITSFVRNRNKYFIIFMDDLSFEEYETEYKYLKALIDGSVEKKPDNLLIYATSNRRHLVKETWSDREKTEEVHISDSVQEKISLADRFGIVLTYTSPSQEEYLKIVEALAEKHNLPVPKTELREKALQWQAWHNGRSGRTAKQFIDYLMGKL